MSGSTQNHAGAATRQKTPSREQGAGENLLHPDQRGRQLLIKLREGAVYGRLVSLRLVSGCYEMEADVSGITRRLDVEQLWLRKPDDTRTEVYANDLQSQDSGIAGELYVLTGTDTLEEAMT